MINEDGFIKFTDRFEAGKALADKLLIYKSDNPVIVALPRGGVPVGYEIAKKLDAKLEVLIVRKIGSPMNPEFGIGAISEGGALFLDNKSVLRLGITRDLLKKIIKKEEKEVKRQVNIFRKGKAFEDVRNRTIILVDDGLATGVTAKCALTALNLTMPGKLIFAAPVCAYDTSQSFGRSAEIVCSIFPSDLHAIGKYYNNFTQITDEEVIKLLKL